MGSGGLCLPEAIGRWAVKVPKSKVWSTFDGFLKMLINICIIEVGNVVSATPQIL